ncbi:TetR/AcrR family transcriptional regulator [Ornithinimicrobium murale]|uniref:TetR/AcrR family transcriptional regulator n=1 Tax=Ornithinimicrobium murale TaxID=1050153 RepID=UPI00192E1C27|nr:TetR/AcrR family transcriptional regulator [Ornithinimicrobium murale]
MAGEQGRRAQHKSRTRQAIQLAAVELFEERGYDATTIEDIVQRAGVSPRTFFRYFPRKELTLFSGDASEYFIELISAAPGHLEPVDLLHWCMRELLNVEASELDRRRQTLRRQLRAQPAIKLEIFYLEEHLRDRLRAAFTDLFHSDRWPTQTGSGPRTPTEHPPTARADVLLALYSGAGRALLNENGNPEQILDEWFAALRSVGI